MTLLADKVAVVTGSGRGIGRAVAMALASEGAAVGLAARSREEIEAVAHDIRKQGGRALAVQTDLACQDEVDVLFARVNIELGQVDILVNNAAMLGPTGMLWEVDPNAWLEVFNVNVVSMVRCARAVLPEMVARRSGKIINVGSIAGWSDDWAARYPEWTAYAATKAAIIRFSYCLAQQVKSYGINVNCVGVGAYTRMNDEALQALARSRNKPPPPTSEQIPAEERSLPEENAPAFVFLASSPSNHITGTYFEANTLPSRLKRSA